MEFLITGLIIYIAYASWKAYTHPSHTLGRQAANMNWIYLGRIKDADGYKNVRIKRDEMIAEISYINGNVNLLEPYHAEPFRNFIELEQWLASHQEVIDETIEQASVDKIEDNLTQSENPDNNADIYFKPRPDHEIWKLVTHDNYELIQSWFESLCEQAALDKYKSTNDLPDEVLVKISDASNDIQKKAAVSHALLIILAHQYVDADVILRQLHKKHWLAKMVSEADFAPPITSYIKYVNSTYFNNAF